MNSEQEIRTNITDKNIIRHLVRYLKERKKAYIISLILMVIAVLIDIYLPVLQGKISKMLGTDLNTFAVVLQIIIAYAFLSLITYGIQYAQTMILQKTGQGIIYDIRNDVFEQIEKLSISQLVLIPVGKLVTRVTSDVNTLNELFTSILINLIKNAFTIVGVIAIMIMTNPLLSLYVLMMTPVVFVISLVFRKISRRVYREVRHSISNVNAFLSENISGIKVTQIFNQEQTKLAEFREKNENYRKSLIKQIFTFAVFRPIIQALYFLTVIIIFTVGSYNSIKGGPITYDILITFNQFVNLLFTPIQEIAEEFNLLQSSFASSERIFETLDTAPCITDSENAIELTDLKGEIEFKHVWFRYIEEEWVLKDVSFKINAGDTVAFVGATGSGKTTILSLMVRNYEIQKGQILIDGIDIKQIKIASLRKNIGQMLQDVFLFSGTILSNIKMRDENISLPEVKEACKYVNASHFIEKLPHQYDEIVRERGNNFSQGERQLLSFARTIVHKPKVMILDEATANIDTETEVLIQDSLEKMMNIGTMIIVAHRLSTIQHADKIIVLNKGRIIEEGNHQSLLKNKKLYYKLYQLQYQNKENL